MAYASINFKNPQTGAVRVAPVGFSWTTLFFNFFPAMLRGQGSAAFIILLITLITGGIAWLIFPFLYNKMYVNFLLEKGYAVQNATEDTSVLSKKLKIDLPALSQYQYMPALRETRAVS